MMFDTIALNLFIPLSDLFTFLGFLYLFSYQTKPNSRRAKNALPSDSSMQEMRSLFKLATH
jgi:hypothetical protein